MAKKPVIVPTEDVVEAPVVEEAPEFVACSQCGYPDDCAKANWCVKGFK
jgi:hypothetical protein